MLRVRDLEVCYGDVQVLWKVDLDVEAGERVALVGANGAGKSTFLRAVTGLVGISRGTVEFDGHPIAGLPAERIARLGISHVPEGRHVFGEMTVLENLQAGALHGEAKRRRRETLEQVTSIFPRLAERKNQLAATLSGGEQQMLAVGRGLMSRPRLLLLDEPSVGLSPRMADEVFETLLAVSSAGLGFLLVEQNVPRSLAISKRAYVLESGRIVLSGPSSEIERDEGVRKAYLGM